MAELHRVKGELLLQQDSLDAAEAEYAEAVAIAAAQRAKSLELRAVARLARLWQRQGESAKARRKLAECLAGFTEGFDTGDLQDANALLVQ
jgi:adenylate cyclase